VFWGAWGTQRPSEEALFIAIAKSYLTKKKRTMTLTKDNQPVGESFIYPNRSSSFKNDLM